MIFTTQCLLGGAVVETTYERDERGNVSGGTSRLVQEQGTGDTSRFGWVDSVPLEEED